MKIVICGSYGAKNKGDEMILSGLLAMLKDISPKAEITVLSADPAATQIEHKVKSLPQFAAGIRSLFSSQKKSSEAVKNCDFFILGGGGLFGSLTFRANLIWGIQAYQAYRRARPVLMLGQSIGELKGFWRKWIVKKLFQKAHYISVRDKDSKKRLEKLGVKHVHVAPDYAFYQMPTQILAEKKTVAIALRAGVPLDPQISKVISWFKEKNWQISYTNFSEPHDRILHQQLDPDASFVLPEDIASKEVLIGMRLHSIITAINYQVPFLALSYAPKVSAILKDYRLSGQILDFQHFQRQLEGTEELRKDLLRLRKEIAQKHRIESQRLKQFLQQG